MTVQITNVEYPLSDIDLQVTKTDLNGVITYANLDFEEASGYSRDEIIGKSHSIIHHPDMPLEVFTDLWQTLKEGRTWIGIIKNLRKDGGYFWTLINVTPDYEHGKLIGYLASRRKATREEIDFFEPAYKTLKRGTDKTLTIKNCFLYRHNWRNRLLFYKRFTIKQRIIVMISLFTVIISSISGIGLYEMNELMQMQVNMRLEDYNETHLKFEHVVKTILALCVVGFSFSILLGVRLYKLIALPLKAVSHSMRHCDHRDIRIKGGTVTEIT